MDKKRWRKKTKVWPSIGVVAIMLGMGCSTDRDAADFFVPDDAGTLVVDALMTVGEPFPHVFLTRALSPDVAYTQGAAAERFAMVTIRAHPAGPLITYSESIHVGVYEPDSSPSDTVAAQTTYDLTVTTPRGETLRATTTTPENFAVREWVLLDDGGKRIRRKLRTFAERGDSVYFAPENQLVYSDGLLEARFQRPNVDAFQVGVFSLDLESDFVIEPEFFEDEDFDDIQRQGSSPALEALDGTVRLPWFAIFFQGRYMVKVLALDRNAYDFVRSIPQDDSGFSFGGTFGDVFERPIFHVQGGIGLFGSAAVDSVGFFILPRP